MKTCEMCGIVGIMGLELGSTRALARGITTLNSGVLEATGVVGEGANHRTRGRVCSPLNGMDLLRHRSGGGRRGLGRFFFFLADDGGNGLQFIAFGEVN
jgi:hypothetical protein